MRPIYVIKDSNSLLKSNNNHDSHDNGGHVVDRFGNAAAAHKARAYATSSMSVSSPTSLLNVSDLSNLSSPFFLNANNLAAGAAGFKSKLTSGARSSSVTCGQPIGSNMMAGSSHLNLSTSGRSTSSAANPSSSSSSNSSSFVYSSSTATGKSGKNAAAPVSASNVCLSNMVHASYQPNSSNNNNATGGGGSLSNLSSYSCQSMPPSSTTTTTADCSPPFYLIALPTKTVTGQPSETTNDLNNNYKANMMLIDHHHHHLQNSNISQHQPNVKPRPLSEVDTTSLFSPSKISRLQQQKSSTTNINDRFNYQSQISGGDYWKEFILDASNYESSLSHYNAPNQPGGSETTPLQTPSTGIPTPHRRTPVQPAGGDKATKASTTTSSSSSALTTSKVRTTTIMSSTVASSSSPATEVEPAETAAEAKATEAEAVENVAATAPPVPASSPPASPSKQQQQTVISSSSSKTATPVHVPVTTTTTTTSSSDRRLAGGNDANKLVASYPISYSSTSTTTTVASTTSPYKSTIAPRPTVISRRAMDRNATSQAVMPYASNAGGSSINSYAIAMRPAAQSAAGIALKETRENERKQLSELNDRFAGYVERVRFLEAQNKKLQIELDMLKSKWGQETKHIEKMYQVELEEARSVLNDTSKTKDTLQVKLDRNEQELNEMKKRYYELENQLARDKEKIAALQDQIAANESEIGLIRRRLTDLQDEEKRYKLEAQRMMNEIQRVSYELECEVKQRLSLENDKQSLEEELVFLKEVHSKEIEELKHLSFKDSGIDPSTFFKSELSTAIKEIREEYENLNQSQRNELEGWYRMKISEIQRKNAQAIGSARMNESEFSREQAKKLRTQITDSKRNITDLKAKNAELESRIRDLEEEIKREENDSSQILTHKEHEIQILKEELNRIIAEYDDLMATKSDLEVEIRTYRKLLEGEENRDGLRQIVETIEHRARAITAGPSAASGYSSVVCREESSSPKCCSDEEEEAGSQSCSEPEEDVFYEKLGEGEAEEEEEELNDEDLLEFEFDLTNILAQSGRQQQQQQQPNNISNNNFELDDSQLVETFKNYKSLYNEFNENVSKLLLSSDLETESELLERVNEQLEAINKSFEISQSAKSRRPRVHQEPSAATACQSGGDFSGGGHCSVCTQIKQQNHQTTTTTKLHDANDYYRLMFAEKSSMSSSQADQQQALNQSDQMIAVGHAPRKLSSSVTVTRYNSTSSTPQISTRIRFFQEMALATTNTATTNPSSHIPPNADPDHN